MISFIKNNVKEVFFFGLVGVTATATHYLIALGCLKLIGINLYAANLLGYLSAVAVSFFGHSLLTFNVGVKIKFLGPFVLVSISTFLLSEGLLWVLEENIQIAPHISLAIVVTTIPIITYLLNKFWVYR